MAGHSKWHNIRHKKAAQDAKKAKIYAKVAKIIELAARSGADPDLNPALASALAKAKSYNVPKDIVERAIKKGSWQLEWQKLEEVIYEGYGPWGTALLIKAVTDNKNRTNANVRAILNKFWGSLGAPGSVAWQFDEKWMIIIDGKVAKKVEKGKEIEEVVPINPEAIEEEILNFDIEDFELDEDGILTVITSKENFANVAKELENSGFHIREYELEYVPQSKVNLTQDNEQKLIKLIDALEEDDDIDRVYHNAA